MDIKDEVHLNLGTAATRNSAPKNKYDEEAPYELTEFLEDLGMVTGDELCDEMFITSPNEIKFDIGFAPENMEIGLTEENKEIITSDVGEIRIFYDPETDSWKKDLHDIQKALDSIKPLGNDFWDEKTDDNGDITEPVIENKGSVEFVYDDCDECCLDVEQRRRAEEFFNAIFRYLWDLKDNGWHLQ
ncbi:hypothetical protein Metev_2294 (plasmid) [Methanohalobium evestigatum Z-7303]|uniref:Uncharacterized protein n=1 Tax=Methanohalobium evestigatum (strain ATCC BAA-1072 / DSM 3721 / NBRC 107634 / OCM 161 / Z-7303) TaxID=644295 RepID=D7EBY8_METEZ|nr:hypothetical protein [Methanohalobium evestigatum]ADI75110.1 hypothetical protein Metev_2294 [Methanohalobium evestigatum Z-7303]